MTDKTTGATGNDASLIEIGKDSADYPGVLAEIAAAPGRLFVRGNLNALHLPAIAIVGSRNPTAGGRETAWRFARHLADTGFCIVSGLAQGIDAAAHEGALAAGGVTVAVLGHGPDQVYPRGNTGLARRIVERGALVTEYEPGVPPLRHHFPERNRIISGLALGTLVVEAAKKSGSLITARLAGEQGREVFAIPGSIHNPMVRGCHHLIRQGARLVETADDILSELEPLVGHLRAQAETGVTDSASQERDDPDYVLLLDALGYDPQTPDELAEKSGLTIEQVSSMLLILELEGKIEPLPGGKVSRSSR